MKVPVAHLILLTSTLLCCTFAHADSKKYAIFNGFVGQHDDKDVIESVDSRAGYFFSTNNDDGPQFQAQAEVAWDSTSNDDLSFTKAWLGMASTEWGELRLGLHNNAFNMTARSSQSIYIDNQTMTDYAAPDNDKVGVHYVRRMGPYGVMLSAENGNQQSALASYRTQKYYFAIGAQAADDRSLNQQRLTIQRYFNKTIAVPSASKKNNAAPLPLLSSIGLTHNSIDHSHAEGDIKHHTDANLNLHSGKYFGHLQIRQSAYKNNQKSEGLAIELGKSLNSNTQLFFHHSRDNGDEATEMSGLGIRYKF